MAKSQMGLDNWLHIVSSAIANYVDEGGMARVLIDNGLVVVEFDAAADDDRLHPDFVKLIEDFNE
jgi:hypothetical protein